MGEEAIIEEMTKIPLSTTSAHFILIHGVNHGGWCWYKVRTLLEASGHTVTCLDLKGSGVDGADPDTILSFHDYNQPLVDFMSSLPIHHKVILVGHSAGGMSVTDAIHKFPNNIHAAIYVGATMLKFGIRTPHDVVDGVPDLSEWGQPFDFGYGLGKGKPPTSAIIKQPLQRTILYQMSPIEDCTLATMLLRRFPLAITEGKTEDGPNSDRVPRIYIKTLQDRVLKPAQQDAMIKRWAPCEVYPIDTDHCPFFSAPFLFVGLLIKVADLDSAHCSNNTA